jgi:hypothetical protein
MMCGDQKSSKHIESKFLRTLTRTLRNFYDLRVPIEIGLELGR